MFRTPKQCRNVLELIRKRLFWCFILSILTKKLLFWSFFLDLPKGNGFGGVALNMSKFWPKFVIYRPKTASCDRKWCSQHPNNVETYWNWLGKDFVILCLVIFDQKMAVLEHFQKSGFDHRKGHILGGINFFSPQAEIFFGHWQLGTLLIH